MVLFGSLRLGRQSGESIACKRHALKSELD